MNFFEAQRLARRNTFYLVILFLMNIIILSFINTMAFSYFIFKYSDSNSFPQMKFPFHFFLFSIFIFLIVTAYFIYNLPDSQTLIQNLGGHLLETPITDDEKKLTNVIEEMSIASGVPLPWIYVLKNESSINAFTAGTTPKDFVIAVTGGAMAQLSRDELQGVIAHEFSHILNEDMKLNNTLAGVISAFLFFSNLSEGILKRRDRSVSRSKKDSEVTMAALILWIIGLLGHTLGRLIQGLISRQREYLADAASAQFTRNPEGLAGALAKIHLGAGSQIKLLDRMEYAHIFFASGINQVLVEKIPTHPPIQERIKKLLPRQDLENFYDEISKDISEDSKLKEISRSESDKIATTTITTGSILDSIGTPTSENLAISTTTTLQLQEIRQQLRLESTARAAIAMIILHSQTDYLESSPLLNEDFKTNSVFEKIKASIDSQDDLHRVAIYHYSLQTLRGLSLKEKESFLAHIKEVIDRDQKINLCEGLLYLNAQILLLPSTVLIKKPRLTRDLLPLIKKMPEESENIDLKVIQEFIQSLRSIPLANKRKVMEELIPAFMGSKYPRPEELRLLALAINIPVPPLSKEKVLV